MFNYILSKLFNKKRQSIGLHENKTMLYFIDMEIKKSIFIKDECKPYILNKFYLEHTFHYGTTILTNEEKRELGLNVRIKAYKEVMDVLNDEWEEYYTNPKIVIANIYYKARGVKSLADNYYRAKGLGIKSYDFKIPFGEYCDWCKSNNDKEFSFEVDVSDLIIKNCTCVGNNIHDIKCNQLW